MRTVLTGVLAVALSLVLAAFDGLWFSDHAAVALATIAGVTAAGAIASAARLGREKELVNVMAVADVAQRVLLQPLPRRVGRDLIAVRYISAAAAARIGGDLRRLRGAGSRQPLPPFLLGVLGQPPLDHGIRRRRRPGLVLEPRRDDHTTCTAVAPDLVFTSSPTAPGHSTA